MPLVTTKEMFKKAYEGHYAIGAFNVNDMEIIQGIVNACREKKSPVVLQASSSAIKYAGIKYLRNMVEAAICDTNIDIALHLNHGANIDQIKLAVENGFTSVMIDGSHYEYKDNVKITKEAVEYAHSMGVVVEAQLGKLECTEDEMNVQCNTYTDPDQAVDFVKQTDIDSLAVAIGTSHDAHKFNGKVKLEFSILEQIQNKLPGFPIVLHGASAVDSKYVDMYNKFGGKIEEAQGVPTEMLKKAASMAVCKINMDTDIRLAMAAAIRKFFIENPEEFDPRKFMGAARTTIQDLVKNKLTDVLGSAGKL